VEARQRLEQLEGGEAARAAASDDAEEPVPHAVAADEVDAGRTPLELLLSSRSDLLLSNQKLLWCCTLTFFCPI
jgi:hypothetical protein